MVKRIIGFLIVITGLLLLLSKLDVISFDDIYGIVFSLGTVIVGIVGLIERKRFDLFLSLLVLFGSMYFLVDINVIERNVIDIAFLPTIVIGIGLSLLFSYPSKKISTRPITSYVAIFSGVEDKNESKEYISSEITAIFGGAEVDYRKMKIKDNVGYINVTAIFGGATIILPEDVKVTIKGLPMFGGAENRTISNEDAKKEIIINYTAVFGGVEIKN